MVLGSTALAKARRTLLAVPLALALGRCRTTGAFRPHLRSHSSLQQHRHYSHHAATTRIRMASTTTDDNRGKSAQAAWMLDQFSPGMVRSWLAESWFGTNLN